MLKLLIASLIFIPTTAVFANDYPTIDVDDVAHYLVVEDEATGDEWWTDDGYCVKKGFEWASESMSTLSSELAPLVAMDEDGSIVKTYDSNNGKLWVVATVECE